MSDRDPELNDIVNSLNDNIISTLKKGLRPLINKMNKENSSYNALSKMIRELPEFKKLLDENIELKCQVRQLRQQLDFIKSLRETDEEDNNKADVDNDYKYSRENYYNLIERGQEAIDGILDIAREGQHPRAYEVAGQLIGQVGQTVDKLQDLQKKLKDLKELPKTANANIKNALFVGSTAELQKMLNKKTVETNSERKKENENFEGKNITPEKTDTKD